MPAAVAYQERKDIAAETGECIKRGCCAQAVDGSAYCEPHGTAQRDQDRRYRKRLRKQRKRNKQCRDCGVKLPAGERTWCKAHRLTNRRFSKLLGAVESVVESADEKASRIAAATSRRNEGRDRYRGQQRRGQRPHATLNAEDVAMAADRFEAFRAGLEVLASPDARLWRRAERDHVVAATLNQGELTQRHIGDVLDRLAGRPRGAVRCSSGEHVYEPGARACVCGEVAAADHFQKRHGRRDGER